MRQVAPSNCNCVAFLKLRKCLPFRDEWRTAHQSQDGHWKSRQYLLHVWKPSNVHINNNCWHDNKSLDSMCTIKSIIKGPKPQQMTEGNCLWPAPVPMKTHGMDAPCHSAQSSPGLAVSLISGEWEGAKRCFWATHGGLQQVSTKAHPLPRAREHRSRAFPRLHSVGRKFWALDGVSENKKSVFTQLPVQLPKNNGASAIFSF